MTHKRATISSAQSRSGQTMIFMIVVLVLLAFVVLWNFDVHTIFHLKSRTQNAGDAAALSAARWQGITLNLIGDLNIMQAVALSQGDSNTSAQVSSIQARLCYAGPMLALLAAQQAAKNNGIYVNAQFTSYTIEHANEILTEYIDVFAEPYPNCWQDYGNMLYNIALQGIAAGPDNARFYSDYTGGHILLGMSFYDAVAGRDWCWFKWNAMTLLETYIDYQSWPALPPQIQQVHPSNSEIFGLGLLPLQATLPGGVETVPLLNNLAANRDLSIVTISNAVAEIQCTWYTYNPSVWTPWTAMSLEGEYPFPAAGPVRPQYDYAGADTAIRIEATAERLTPGSSGGKITWTAAAKPFGYLSDEGGVIKPNQFDLVIPAYHDVRLIALDASSTPAGGSYNLAWRQHIGIHLLQYMQDGLSGVEASCRYCQALVTWESQSFRVSGLQWLSNTNNCQPPPVVPGAPGGSPGGGGGGGGGGKGGGGGRRRGH